MLQPEGYAGIDGARKMLNDMIYKASKSVMRLSVRQLKLHFLPHVLARSCSALLEAWPFPFRSIGTRDFNSLFFS